MPEVPNAYYRTSIKALILDSDKRFLLVKGESDMWDLPGGGLDWGENAHECMVREIREEMGIEVLSVATQPSYFVSVLSDDKEPIWINNVIYAVELKHLNFASSDECLELGFFTKEEAKEKHLFSNVGKFLELYNSEKH